LQEIFPGLPIVIPSTIAAPFIPPLSGIGIEKDHFSMLITVSTFLLIGELMKVLTPVTMQARYISNTLQVMNQLKDYFYHFVYLPLVMTSK